MDINFKGGYFNFSYFVQSVHGLSGHCPWTLSSPPGFCPGCPWTMSRLSTESMNNVHWVHGQCPLNPWTLSSLAGLTGLCPWTHWTLSRVSMDIVQTVHWVHGKCPLSPWTMSTESTESTDFLQTGVIGHICQWTRIFFFWWTQLDHKGNPSDKLWKNPTSSFWGNAIRRKSLQKDWQMDGRTLGQMDTG